MNDHSSATGPFAAALRFAWWGRVSTEDQQDPTLSLPRQLRSSRAAIPSGAVIVAHFYDVESGRRDLELRGRGSAHERFQIPIPRDGGIQELLDEAARPDRRFDAVICESIERIARRTYYGTKIEHDLERVGVALFAADEPILLSGKRATTILTRRVKQGVAEWYVLEMLEKSWDGFCEHTRQGWNVGQPPYGYVAEKIPHPVPARRAEGKTKSRLVPDPVRAQAVREIFAWRVGEGLGYAEITERLNADLERYPPPSSPDPARRKDHWSRFSVREILLNPKYTGYMVWNRRARKRGGKTNPPEAWVWSSQPTHEAIVSRSMLDAALAVAKEKQGSGTRSEPTAPESRTSRSYLLRSMVWCHLCRSRMFGKERRGNLYYCCQPERRLGRKAASELPEHPPTVYVRETGLLDGLLGFFGDRIFGPNRRELLEEDLRALEGKADGQHRSRIRSLRRAIELIEARQARQVRNLEHDDDPRGVVFRRIRDRLEELEQDRLAKQEELRSLEDEEDPGRETQVAELLEALPVLPEGLSSAPEERLRRMFECFRLSVSYEKPTNVAHVRVSISEDTVEQVLGNRAFLADGGGEGTNCAALVCAPGRTRTSAPGSGDQCSIP
jgi:site-specific DNA recombinase